MADHLVHGGIGLNIEQSRHIEAADLGDAGNIVAQEIDDHAVFGLRLLVAEHGCDDRLVFLRRCPTRGRALHRPGSEPAAIEAKEQFGRQRQHMRRAGRHQRTMARRRLAPQHRWHQPRAELEHNLSES